MKMRDLETDELLSAGDVLEQHPRYREMVGLEDVTFWSLVLSLAEVGLSRVDSEEERDAKETKCRGRTISTPRGIEERKKDRQRT